ncbi:hypothetical protein Taro_032265 [Colocasia esculenta]|uniref:Uncharacterized protein n=1 Tax=Colocasia esculenta TaxID=4460 RepID=A0A843W1G3_COLES|nr:hypothetical protein [Colocasia esculenta]
MPNHRDRGLNGCNHRSRDFRILPHLPCQPRELLIWTRMSLLVMRSVISELMSSLAKLMRSLYLSLMRSLAELMRSLTELMRSTVSELDEVYDWWRPTSRAADLLGCPRIIGPPCSRRAQAEVKLNLFSESRSAMTSMTAEDVNSRGQLRARTSMTFDPILEVGDHYKKNRK